MSCWLCQLFLEPYLVWPFRSLGMVDYSYLVETVFLPHNLKVLHSPVSPPTSQVAPSKVPVSLSSVLDQTRLRLHTSFLLFLNLDDVIQFQGLNSHLYSEGSSLYQPLDLLSSRMSVWMSERYQVSLCTEKTQQAQIRVPKWFSPLVVIILCHHQVSSVWLESYFFRTQSPLFWSICRVWF